MAKESNFFNDINVEEDQCNIENQVSMEKHSPTIRVTEKTQFPTIVTQSDEEVCFQASGPSHSSNILPKLEIILKSTFACLDSIRPESIQATYRLPVRKGFRDEELVLRFHEVSEDDVKRIKFIVSKLDELIISGDREFAWDREVFDASLHEKISTVVSAFIKLHGGRTIRYPVEVRVDETNVDLRGKFATKPDMTDNRPVMLDLVGQFVGSLKKKEADIGFTIPPLVKLYIEQGRLVALATTGSKRISQFPDTPTLSELGYPDLVGDQWLGFFMPAKTPPTVAARFQQAMAEILKAPAVVKRLAEDGNSPVGSTPTEFKAYVSTEIRRWKPLVALLNKSGK